MEFISKIIDYWFGEDKKETHAEKETAEENDEENDEEEETAVKINDYKKHLQEKVPEYVKIVFDFANFIELELHIYFKGDYLGHVIVKRAKIEALDLEEEKRIIEVISNMIKKREDELESLKLRKEMEKEKLEFMRLRNKILKKKLGERTDIDVLSRDHMEICEE